MNKQKILETQISTFKKIEISNLPKKIPDFKNSFDSKDNIIKKWFINWIDTILKSNNEKEHLLLPSKQILAKHLNVSVGTIQSAIRYIEDLGYVESKQKIGTIIKTSKKSVFKKLTSKRDLTINHIRQYIIEHNFKKDQILPDLNFVIKTLNTRVETARDLVLKLYNTTNEMIKTAQLAEMAIVYGNRYRSTYKEIEFSLIKAEKEFRSGDYKKSLETSLNALNMVEPGIHKRLMSAYES